MKKHMSRNTILMVVLDLVLGIVLSLYIANTGTVPAADNAATYTDGTYTASAKGCLSDVAVTVTITGGKVTGVNIDASGETPALGGKAAESLAVSLQADDRFFVGAALESPGLRWLGGCCFRQHHDQRRHLHRHGRLSGAGRTVIANTQLLHGICACSSFFVRNALSVSLRSPAPPKG